MRQRRSIWPIWSIKFSSLVSGDLVDWGLKLFGTCRENKGKYEILLDFLTGKSDIVMYNCIDRKYSVEIITQCKVAGS